MKTQAKTTQAKTPRIKLLVAENPKRGKSASRFALYKNGLTVDTYIEKSVAAGNTPALARADLKWDTERKFIAIA
jgi:hypothetical protein